MNMRRWPWFRLWCDDTDPPWFIYWLLLMNLLTLSGVVIIVLAVVATISACTNTISLTVNLPTDSTPTLVEPQPQPQHDSFNL